MRLLVPIALLALAASSHALLIDGFTDGAFDSGSVTPTTSYYVQTTSAPTAWSGTRTHVIYGQNAGAATSRVTVDPSSGAYAARMDNGVVNGFTEIVYGRPYNATFQSDLRPNTSINITIASSAQPLTVLVGLRGSSSSSFISNFQTIAPTATPVTLTLSLNLGPNFTEQAYTALYGEAQQIFVDFSNPGTANGASSMDLRVSRIEAVPEPFTLAALATGVGVFSLRRRKR